MNLHIYSTTHSFRKKLPTLSNYPSLNGWTHNKILMMGGKKKFMRYLWRDASDIQTGSTKCGIFFDTHRLKKEGFIKNVYISVLHTVTHWVSSLFWNYLHSHSSIVVNGLLFSMTLDLTTFFRVIFRVFLRMLQIFVLVEDPFIFHDKLPCGGCWNVLCVYCTIVNIWFLFVSLL